MRRMRSTPLPPLPVIALYFYPIHADLRTVWMTSSHASGESAGAMSVMLHLVSPLSAGLFHGAIMESSPSAFQYQDYVAQKLTYGDKFVSYANCSADPASSKKNDPAAVMRCLRAMPAKEAFDVGEKAASDATAGLFDRILEGGRLEDALAMEWASSRPHYPTGLHL